MNKGSQAPAPMANPIHVASGAGAKAPAGSVKQPFTAAARPGKAAKK